MTNLKTWNRGEQPLESSLPHIIVDSRGVRQRPLPEFPPFPNRTQATKALNLLRKRPSPFIIGDPKTWRVEPVREEK